MTPVGASSAPEILRCSSHAATGSAKTRLSTRSGSTRIRDPLPESEELEEVTHPVERVTDQPYRSACEADQQPGIHRLLKGFTGGGAMLEHRRHPVGGGARQ